MKLESSFSARGRLLLWVEVLGLMAGIGVVDFITGAEISLFALYGVPIVIAAWSFDRVHGLGSAVLSTAVWWYANHGEHPHRTLSGFWFAGLTRFAYFSFVAIGTAALRAQREGDRERIAALERARELEAEIIRASERERQRIGRDLQDGLCRCLLVVNRAAKSLAEQLAAAGLPAAAEAREIEALIEDGAIHARSIARGLVPVSMDAAGLGGALAELASTTERLTRVSIGFVDTPASRSVDPESALQLYRIAQEALGNAIRHGDSKHITISLGEDHRCLTLSVIDDGRGFADSGIRRAGMGLASMRCRAAAIGAALEIGARPEGGTMLVCNVPLDRAGACQPATAVFNELH